MKTGPRDRSRTRALAVLIAAVLLAAAHGAAIAGPAAPVEGTTAPTSSDLKEAFELEYRLFLAAPFYLPGSYDPRSSRGPEYSPETVGFRVPNSWLSLSVSLHGTPILSWNGPTAR
jgi:hypothetical protein